MPGATQSLMTGGVSSCFVDPSTGLASAIGSLANHPALGGEDAGFATFLSNLATHVNSQLAALPKTLPMLAAIETTQKRVATSEGQLPGKDGGSTLNGAFVGLDGVKPLLTNLHTQLQAVLAAAPLPTAPVPGQPPAANVTVPKVKALLTGASTSLTSLASTAAASLNQGMDQLHNYAFASFMNLPKSPAIDRFMSAYVSVPLSLGVEKDIMSASSSALQGTVVPTPMVLSKPDSIAPPVIGDQPVTMSASDKAALQAVVAAKKAILDAAASTLQASVAQCQAWQAANNYKAVKQAWESTTGPAEAEAWNALKDRYAAEVYGDYQEKYTAWSLAKETYSQALAKYSSALNG